MRSPCLPSCLLLSAALLPHASGDSADVIFQQPVSNADGSVLGTIDIHGGEEPADAVYDFALRHDLQEHQRNSVLDHICRKIPCTRKRALLWQNDVLGEDDTVVGTFQLFDGIEPADQAHDFVLRHGLSVGHRNAILSAACEVVECHREYPIIWRKSVNVAGKFVNIELKEGEEPADVIFSTLQPYNAPSTERRKVFELAKQDDIPYTREHALVYSNDIRDDNEKSIGILQIFDDDNESVDKLYNFAVEHNATDIFDQMSQTILPQICSLVGCRRSSPVVWKKAITIAGAPLGTLEVLKDEEPVDALDRFIQWAGLGEIYGNGASSYRDNTLGALCGELICTRTVPVVYRKEIKGDKGESLGFVEVFEGEEVVDAVVRFLRKKKVQLDHIALKNYFFQHACSYPRLRCTRNVAIIFDQEMKTEDGEPIGRLTIMENVEPADAIFEWAKHHGISEEYLFGAIESVCKADGVICNRDAPIVKSFPMSGPNGHVGVFQLKLREEPVDALYAFFSKHGLFNKEWDFRAVVSQVCAMPDLVCNRMHAIKFHDDNFTMGGISIGPLLIMEGQEVIDVLYEKRMQFNLTIEDQMASFTEICKQESVHCSRTKAIVYKLSGITKNDFERFGNETCKRKFASFQHLHSFTSFKIGEKIAEFLKGEQVTNTIEHPLFGPILLFKVFAGQAWILSRIRKKRRLHALQHLIVYCFAFMCFSFVFVSCIMPAGEMDAAFHVHDGACPDLEIFEGEESADAVMRWAKEAAKEHHPVVREKVHWELLDKACSEAERAPCTRRRAWEPIDMGSVTLFGQHHKIEYWNPMVDPISRLKCIPAMDGKADSCLEDAAKSFCQRLQPQFAGCQKDITLHMADQFNTYEERRVHSKKPYIKVGLEFDVPAEEIMGKIAILVRSRGMNIAPFSRIDNGTATYPKWDSHTEEAWKFIDNFMKLKDPETREWTDKPCKEYFGGALCAKHDKDGNMIIEV